MEFSLDLCTGEETVITVSMDRDWSPGRTMVEEVKALHGEGCLVFDRTPGLIHPRVVLPECPAIISDKQPPTYVLLKTGYVRCISTAIVDPVFPSLIWVV